MLTNNKYLIKELNWDTEMFKVNSAKVILLKEISINDLEFIKEFVRKQEYKFITIENKSNNEKNNILIKKINDVFLADVNIQFKRETNSEDKYYKNENIKIENNFNKNQDIVEIAEKSFIYSRFINDDKLNDNKYNVYKEWTKNSFEKEDKYFCYYKLNDKILGYILFSIEDNKQKIFLELIGIEKSYKGQGIGSKLLEELNKFGFDNEIRYIKVGTQINNINAQNFYIKNGFEHTENNSIYHWWIR